MTRRILYAVVALLVAAGLVWALLPKRVPVDTARIGPQTIRVLVEDEGTARIREVFTVSAPIAGQLLRPDLLAGDAVTAGRTVIASIQPAAPPLLDARARGIALAAEGAAIAGVDLARAELSQQEAQRAFLQAEAARALTLLQRRAISERAYQKAMLDETAAAAAVASAKAGLLVRERELDSARAALSPVVDRDRTGTCCVTVPAPVSGRVLRVLAESEQVVLPGTPLVEIGDPADIEIVVDLLSRDAVQIVPGAAAVIDGWGGAALAARVTRIDPTARTQVSALGIEEQRVTVVLDLVGDAADRAALGHGFRVLAHITVRQRDDVLSVPVGALFRDGADWAVFVVQEGRAQLRRVTIGDRDAQYASVTEGLAAGDTVILHPGDQVTEGVRVAVTAAAAGAAI